MKFLAVDIGASSGRTIVGTVEPGKISLEETHRFENKIIEIDGEFHWNIPALMTEIKEGIAKSGEVDGIGIDTWGVDYGLIDENGELVENPHAYRDPRNEAAVPVVYKQVPKAKLYGITGLQEMAFNTVFQLTAEKLSNNNSLAKAKHLLFFPQLFSFMLTGEVATEYSIASTSGLLDAKTRTWSSELIETLGYPAEIFGEVKMPGAPAGSYNGTPVYLVGGHDTASAVASVPATDGGDWAYVSSGTWSLIGAELSDPVLTDTAMAADFTNEGGVDGSIRFLKNITGLWLIQECRRIWAEEGNDLTFAEIAKAAEETTDFSSVIDPNDSRFNLPTHMPNEIKAYCEETRQAVPTTVGEIARCCYVSLANAYRTQLDQLTAVTGKQFERLHIVGGGCQAELLSQLAADYCEIPVVTGPVEATAIGNICMQAIANGVLADLTEARQLIADAFTTKTYLPQR